MAQFNSVGQNPIIPANGATGVANPTAHAIAIAEGASNFNFLTLTNGQILIGSTGVDPVPATLTAGTGISISNGAGSITVSATGAGEPWNTVTGTSQSMAVNNGYFANNAGLVTLTLPTTAAVGDMILIGAQGAGGFTIAQNSGQSIVTSSGISTTVGTGGSVSSTSQNQMIVLRCMVANTTFIVQSCTGIYNFV
jgi:hypothetical protein